MEVEALLPEHGRLAVERLRIEPTEILLELRCTDTAAQCPDCQGCARRVHSRYVRTIRDLPWRGTPVVLCWRVRRFFCDNPDCRRRIFAEQLAGLAPRRGRGTVQREQALLAIGLECGGEPGRRLGAELGITTSGDTLLRRVRNVNTARVLHPAAIGIDDFAFRKGQRYGTVIVDHESGDPIDLLDERGSASLESWLAARSSPPSVVTRDRSGTYAKAIATAAPEALQVADRWHLLANCREALVRILDRHHAPVTEATKAARSKVSGPGTDSAMAQTEANPPPATDVPTASAPISRNQQQSLDRRAKRLARYEQVLELRRQGLSQRAITRQMKMSPAQVIKLLGAGAFPERVKTHRPKQVDRYVGQLRQRWDSGVRNARELTEHIRALGYTGGGDMVRRCVAPCRTPQEREKLPGARPKPHSLPSMKLQRPHRCKRIIECAEEPLSRADYQLTRENLGRAVSSSLRKNYSPRSLPAQCRHTPGRHRLHYLSSCIHNVRNVTRLSL